MHFSLWYHFTLFCFNCVSVVINRHVVGQFRINDCPEKWQFTVRILIAELCPIEGTTAIASESPIQLCHHIPIWIAQPTSSGIFSTQYEQ